MQHSETYGEISSALFKVQGEIESLPKTADNPFYKSKYVPLEAIQAALHPLLHANGVLLTQTTRENGGVPSIPIITTFLHVFSGEWMSSVLEIPVKDMNPQECGKVITYGRRYALASFLSLVTEKDDDAEGAMKRNDSPKASDGSSDDTDIGDLL